MRSMPILSETGASRQVRASGAEFDVIVVGAGFAGLYMLHRLRGLGFSARVLEAGSGVGGTWYWNRYPGARCDVESVEYSYQFSPELQQEWDWSERYAVQRVGIIGTGSSAVQSIPIIAEAEHLYVFQRTPSFVVPAHNAPLDPREQQAIKAEYPALRALAKTRRNGLFCETRNVSALAVSEEERERAFRERWDRGGLCYTGTFNDLLIDSQANETAADFLRARIREVVKDPAIAEALSPRTVVCGKRLCIDIGYYETFNRENVTLIDLNKAPLGEITRDGLTAGGKPYRLDSIVFAIGFDAMTGALTRIDIRGRGGARL